MLDGVAHPVVFLACSDSLQARVIGKAHPATECIGAALGAQTPAQEEAGVRANTLQKLVLGAALGAAGVAEAFRGCHLGEPRRKVRCRRRRRAVGQLRVVGWENGIIIRVLTVKYE